MPKNQENSRLASKQRPAAVSACAPRASVIRRPHCLRTIATNLPSGLGGWGSGGGGGEVTCSHRRFWGSPRGDKQTKRWIRCNRWNNSTRQFYLIVPDFRPGDFCSIPNSIGATFAGLIVAKRHVLALCFCPPYKICRPLS